MIQKPMRMQEQFTMLFWQRVEFGFRFESPKSRMVQNTGSISSRGGAQSHLNSLEWDKRKCFMKMKNLIFFNMRWNIEDGNRKFFAKNRKNLFATDADVDGMTSDC